MKHTLLFSAILHCLPLMAADNFDMKAMQKDLEIAKNILVTLVKTEAGVDIPDKAVDADYIQGYGPVFYLTSRAVASGSMGDTGMQYFLKDPLAPEAPNKQHPGAEEHAEKQEEEAERLERDHARAEQQLLEMKKQEDQIELHIQKGLAPFVQRMSDHIDNDAWEKTVFTFLADYAQLIGQLMPEDKITVRRITSGDFFPLPSKYLAAGEMEQEPADYAITASKKDLELYRKGKISREEFRSRIVIDKHGAGKVPPDIEIFAETMKRYYSPDLTKTFFVGEVPACEVLDDFGIILHAKMYSSYMYNGLYSIPAVGKKDIESGQRKTVIEELYPIFKNDIREFVVDYGRTIRSVRDEDKIILKMKMTRCDACDIPITIDVIVPTQILKQYDQQKIGRDQAVQSVQIKEYF